MINVRRFAILIAMLTVLFCGCKTYAPPVRTTHGGAPEHLAANTTAINIAAAHVLYIDQNPGGNLGLEHAVSERLTIEGGLGGEVGISALTYGGVRFAPYPKAAQNGNVKFTFDLEGGVGLGVGGRYKDSTYVVEMDDGTLDQSDDISPYKRFAGGGYGGFGIGINVKWFDCYLRGRYQLTGARGIPATHFLSSFLGFQFSREFGYLYLGPGLVYYVNRMDESILAFAELGLGLKF